MSAFLHLYFVPSRYELFIECDIGYSMWNTLADNLEGVEGTSDDISSEIDSSFDNSNSSLYRSFDKSFWRLIDNFPDSFCKIVDKDIGISKYIDGGRYFINFFKNFLPVKLSSSVNQLKHIDIFLIKSRELYLRLRNVRQSSSKESYNSVDHYISAWCRFYTERKLNDQFTYFHLPYEYWLVSSR